MQVLSNEIFGGSKLLRICQKTNFLDFFSWKFLTFKVLEKFSGEKPLSLGYSSDASQDEMTVTEIISICSNYPTIQKIKNLCVPENKFIYYTQAQATLLLIK